MNGIINSTVDLGPGKVNLEGYQQIKWFYNHTQQILTKKDSKIHFYNKYFEKKTDLFEDGTLHVTKLWKPDSSEYKITVEDQEGLEITVMIQMDIYSEYGQGPLYTWLRQSLRACAMCPLKSPRPSQGRNKKG